MHGYHWVVGLLAPEMLHHALAHVYHPVDDEP
jgi:hypothetical protein